MSVALPDLKPPDFWRPALAVLAPAAQAPPSTTTHTHTCRPSLVPIILSRSSSAELLLMTVLLRLKIIL